MIYWRFSSPEVRSAGALPPVPLDLPYGRRDGSEKPRRGIDLQRAFVAGRPVVPSDCPPIRVISSYGFAVRTPGLVRVERNPTLLRWREYDDDSSGYGWCRVSGDRWPEGDSGYVASWISGSGGGGGGGVPAPTCTDATPEYCHAPGENTLNPYQLGLEWLGVEIASAYYTALACDWRPCLDSSKPVRTEYFRDGDPLTEGIRSHEWMNTVRARIEKALDEDRAFGTADFHYGDPELFSAEDRKDILWNNIDSVFTFGLRGMPIEQAFMGSYDLEREVIGERGDDVVIEFNLTNASTYNSAKPDPAKVNAKAYGNNSAGNGQDAFAGELWTRQSVRWRETFTSGNAPKGPGTWHPRPGPWAKPSVILKPIWDLFH